MIYAYGDMVSWGINRGWDRYPAKIEGDQLVVSGKGFVATYQKLPSGVLMARFEAGRALSQAVLHPTASLAILYKNKSSDRLNDQNKTNSQPTILRGSYLLQQPPGVSGRLP